MSDPIFFRDPGLVAETLGLIYDRPDPIPWIELVVELTRDGRHWKTVENTIYDLVAFGAISKIGQPKRGRNGIDTRALKPTPLGRAWIDRTLLDLPGD